MATFTFQNSDGPYPLFPTTIIPTSFELRHRRTTLVANSRSMRRQSRSVGGVRIEGTFRFPPLPTVAYAEMIAFFRQLDGRSTIFAYVYQAYAQTTQLIHHYVLVSTTTGHQQTARLLISLFSMSGCQVQLLYLIPLRGTAERLRFAHTLNNYQHCAARWRQTPQALNIVMTVLSGFPLM